MLITAWVVFLPKYGKTVLYISVLKLPLSAPQKPLSLFIPRVYYPTITAPNPLGPLTREYLGPALG